MKFVVKIFTLNDEDRRLVDEALGKRWLVETERTEAFTQGVAVKRNIEKMANSGIKALSVEQLPPREEAEFDIVASIKSFVQRTVDPSLFGGPRAAVGDRSYDVVSGDGRIAYLLVAIIGSITIGRARRMDEAGVKLVERRSDGRYVIKAKDALALDALEFIADVRNYSANDKLPPNFFVDGVRDEVREFDAIMHADADGTKVAEAIGSSGARPIHAGTSTVRFLADRTMLREVATIPEIALLREVSARKLFNDIIRKLVAAPAGHEPAGSSKLDGSGQLVGIADTGLDDAHPDFAGRIVGIEALGRQGDHSDPDGHGTHVAGTVAGSGAASAGALRGVASGASIYFQSIMDARGGLGGLPTDVGDLFASAYQAGVKIHNNSWGAFLESRYGAEAFQVDLFVHEHPDFLPVIAAGNDSRGSDGSDDLRNSEIGFVEYPSISTPASAKNAVTVGASRSSRTSGGYSCMTWKQMWASNFPDDPIAGEKISGDPESLAAFSGRGPVDNHMIKPDLVAPGTDIASTRSAQAPLRNFWGAYPGNAAYAFMGGTSMSAPVVTGAAALVRQYYVEHAEHDPSAALLKATLINGTVRLHGADAKADPDGDPNYHQGFGRLDLSRSLPNIEVADFELAFVDSLRNSSLDFDETGESRAWELAVTELCELRICLCWTDPPANGLQNSLLLLVDDVGTGRRWVSNSDVPRTMNLTSVFDHHGVIARDPKNNVQTVRIGGAAPGKYKVTIVASNLVFPSQSFAMVLAGSFNKFTKS